QLRSDGAHLESLPVPRTAPTRSRPRVALAAVAVMVLVVGAIALLRRDEPPMALGAGGTPVALVPRAAPEDVVSAGGRAAPYDAGPGGLAVYGNDNGRVIVSLAVGGGSFLSGSWSDIDLDGRPGRGRERRRGHPADGRRDANHGARSERPAGRLRCREPVPVVAGQDRARGARAVLRRRCRIDRSARELARAHRPSRVGGSR